MSVAVNRALLVAVASVLLAMVTIQSGASVAKQLFPLIGPEGTAAGFFCISAVAGFQAMASITIRPA